LSYFFGVRFFLDCYCVTGSAVNKNSNGFSPSPDGCDYPFVAVFATKDSASSGKWMAEIARPFAPKPRNNLGKDFVTIEAQK